MAMDFEEFTDRLTDELGVRLHDHGVNNFTIGLKAEEEGGRSQQFVTMHLTGEENIVSASLTQAYERFQDGADVINQDARDAIWRQEEINTFMVTSGAYNPSDLIFRSYTGNYLLHPSVEYDIKKYCKKAGIEAFTAHAFRDTFATRCVESGMRPKTLQTILGHSSISITMALHG